MTYSRRFGIAVTLEIVLLVLWSGSMAGKHRMPAVEPSDFRRDVDLEAFADVAVLDNGRIKSFESFAHGIMNLISGPRKFEGQPASFTYLDLMLRPEAYEDADVIYVKNKALRVDIIDALERTQFHAHDAELAHRLDERLAAFMDHGLISEELLMQPKVALKLETLRADVLRGERFVDMIDTAVFVKQPDWLLGRLAVVPAPGNDPLVPWSSLPEAAQVGHGHGADLEEASTSELWSTFQDMAVAWQAQDAAAVSETSAVLAGLLADVNPEMYPSSTKMSWETWYFRMNNLTWIWWIYLVSAIFLLLSVVYRWRAARIGGVTIFTIAFLMQTAALLLRWWVSGRWPNSNMFEAVTTAAWMGGVMALALEWFARRSAMRTLFLLTSAFASMIALMAAHYMPDALNPGISNMMPVLHDLWLYIHTNMIIWSYVLIFMAAVSGLLYLTHRLCGGDHAFVKVGGAGMLAAPKPSPSVGITPGSELEAAQAIEATGTGRGQIFDGVTLVLMELSFVMLWAGLVMGAIWADHSWGRPWGWDPKEVFALNTFLVFAVLVHVRFKVRDKGLWTALLAVVGALVMLFNWTAINFKIIGLHSYA